MNFSTNYTPIPRPENALASVGENLNTLPLALTVPEASAVLRVGRHAVYELVRCGRLRSLKIGRQIRIPRDALEDFLAAV